MTTHRQRYHRQHLPYILINLISIEEAFRFKEAFRLDFIIIGRYLN